MKRVIPVEGGLIWKAPRKGRFRLDVDYAVDDGRGKGGAGAILRDDLGRVVFAMAKPLPMSVTTLHGELKALVHGICRCVEEGISPVEVYSDSMLAVIATAEEREEVSILFEDLFDFFARVKEFNVLSLNHVRREANRAAHELVRRARFLDSTIVWHDSGPSWLSRIVKDDLK